MFTELIFNGMALCIIVTKTSFEFDNPANPVRETKGEKRGEGVRVNIAPPIKTEGRIPTHLYTILKKNLWEGGGGWSITKL